MKKFIIIFLIWLWPAFLNAEVFYTQDFEGVGEPADWLTVNTVDYDYSTVGLDMEGSECARLDPSAWIRYVFDSNPLDEIWVTFKYRVSEALENSEKLFNTQDDFGHNLGEIYLWSAGPNYRVRYLYGSNAYGLSRAYGNSYYLKIRVKRVGGSGNIAELWLWDGSSWGTSIICNNGTQDYPNQRVVFWNYADTEYIYIDDIKLSTEDLKDPYGGLYPKGGDGLFLLKRR